MRNIMFGFGIMLMLILSIHIVMAIDGRSIRQTEAQSTLSSTIAGVMDDLYLDRRYAIEDSELFIADFIQALSARVTSDSAVTVNVLKMDINKGLLTIEVKETFQYSNGKEGNVTAVKTMILEHEKNPENPEVFVLRYQIEKDGQFVDYKVFDISNGGIVTIPQAPEADGKRFAYWADKNGVSVNFQGTQGNGITVNELAGNQQETVLYAVFQ